jgi:hypothetical protein
MWTNRADGGEDGGDDGGGESGGKCDDDGASPE